MLRFPSIFFLPHDIIYYIGDLGLAYQAFKVAVSVDPSHGEALNNIAVLEMRRQKLEVARSFLSLSVESSPHLFEPMYNTGK